MKDIVQCMIRRINIVLLAWFAFAGFAQAGGSVTGKCEIEESGTYRVKIYCESGVEPDTVRYSVPVVVAKGDSVKITVSYALLDKNTYLSGYGTPNSSVDTTTFTQDGEIDLSVTAKSKTSGKIACCEYEFTIKATYTYKLSATARLSITQNGQSTKYVDDQNAMAKVTFENDGHGILYSLAVSVDVDGQSIGNETVNSLDVGEAGSKTFNLGKLSAGTHVIRGKVGSYATVSKTITVVEGVPTLAVDSPERIISAAGGEIVFSVRGNVKWQTLPDCEWIHLTEGGSGNGVITCRIDRNSIAQARDGGFIVTGEEGVEPVDALIRQTAMTPPRTPDVTVYDDQSPDGLCFTWKEDPLALSYVIYRAESVDGTWRQIARTDGTSYTDDALNPGERLWYKVVAENEVGQSESASFSGMRSVVLDVQPQFNPASCTFYGLQKISCQVTDDATTIHYTLDGSDPLQTSPIWPSEGLTTLETVTVKARAYDSSGHFGPITTATYTKGEVLSAPIVTISGRFMKWDAVPGAAYYRIFYAEGPFAEREEMTWTTGTSCNLLDYTERPSEGAVYTYWVRAYPKQKETLGSDYSNCVHFTPTGDEWVYEYSNAEAHEFLSGGNVILTAGDLRFECLANASLSAGADVQFFVNNTHYVISSGSWPTISAGTSGINVDGGHHINWTANTSTDQRFFGFQTSKSKSTASVQGWWAHPHYIYQRGVDSLVIGKNKTFEHDGGDGELSITVTADGRWSAKSNNDWIVLDVPSCNGSAYLGYHVLPNDTDQQRVGTVKVECGAIQKIFTVTQKSINVVQEHTVTYAPGSFGAGTQVIDTQKNGETFCLRGAMFSRDGYMQTGWATSDGGIKAYELGGSCMADSDLVFYPYWTKVEEPPVVLKPNLAFVTPDGWPAAVYFTDGVDSRESKLTFKEGDAAYLNVGFVNNGNADAPAYKIKHQFLDADGNDVFQPIVTLCSDGQTVGKVACYANWDWSAITQYGTGDFTYKCTLDCDNEIDEDKSDNVRTVAVTIEGLTKRPNLIFYCPSDWPAAVYFTDTIGSRIPKNEFKEMEDVYLNVGFANVGDADAPTFKILHQFIDKDGNDVVTPTVTTCDEGQKSGFYAWIGDASRAAITHCGPGVYTYKCTLDCDNEVDEDKSDNVFTCEITIIENVPDKPEAVWATRGESDAYVEISWETAEGAWSYDLYRSVTDSLPSDASPIKRNLSGNFVRDTDAIPGVKYYYWVKALGAYGVTLSDSSYGYRKVALSVEDETLTVGADGGEGSVIVSVNTSWNASSEMSWITFTTASGSGNGTVTYTVAASTSTEPRTGTITIVAGKDYPETLTIEIVQEGRISEKVPPFTINGVERSAGFGAGWSYANSRLTISEAGNYLLSGSCTNGEVHVYVDGVDACLTLSNLTLISESRSGGVIQLRSGSNVSMFLCETNTLKSGEGRGGIEVPNGAKLSILHSRSVARDFLFVTGGYDAAGIGGNTQGGPGCGTIQIKGGTVVATGGHFAAGIGEGEGEWFDGRMEVEISGGNVYARGGTDASGVGSGFGGWGLRTGSEIRVSGGTLYSCKGEDRTEHGDILDMDTHQIVVTGGSVICGSGSFPKTVVNDQGETVYVVQVELPESFVANGVVTVEGVPDYYGTNDLLAVDGHLAFWLPCGRYELTFSAYDDSGYMRQFTEKVVAGTPPDPPAHQIETGKWNYDYALAEAFADEKGLPLVVFWTNPGCAQCEKLIAAFRTQKFQDWQTSREYVFVYSEGDANVREFVKNASGAFPYVAVLWPSQGVDARFTGRVGMMPVKDGDMIDQFTQSVDNSITVVATPVIIPEDDATFDTESCTVTITCARAGATIYYSTNGSTPRQKDQFKYTQPFTITETTTIKAVAVKDGFTQSEIATVTITKVDPPPLTLASALDEPKLSAVETDGDAEWEPVKDVTAVGGSSARSGVVGMLQRTCLMATVYGKGSLSFKWKVSCEADYSGEYTYDHMTFSTVESGHTNNIAMIDGETGWLSESVTFTTDGPHVILWAYSTDDWEEPGFEDCGWVDNVAWTGDAPPSDIVISDVVTLPKAEVESFMAKYPSLAAQVGEDAEAFAKLPSATGKLDANGNQMYVWQDIIAGTDPTNPEDKFKIVDIKFEDGEIKITWSPDLNENGTKNVRAYTEFGRKELGSSEEWADMKDVNPAEKNDYKFRKVTVDMP